MAVNASITFDLPPLPNYSLKPLPPLINVIPDIYLALVLPIIAYWGVSMIFHFVDEWDLFPQYRLHTPAEVLKRNHVSRFEVFRDVIVQQVIQTIVGLVLSWMDPPAVYGKEDYDIAWWAQNIRVAQSAIPVILATVGIDAASIAARLGPGQAHLAGALVGGQYPDLTQIVDLKGQAIIAPAFAPWEVLLAKAVYHIGVPALQFLLAILIVDTWQYFLHRAMHMNKYLYVTFHSRHHRLYVPYAYGALYNHPFEGFLLDTLGTGIAYLVSGMTVRQSMWFFTMSTIKTVDDHCGYAFPWDPLQHITSNNAGYHDVHHQSWGIKTNFSQPFFTFWDGLLGTKWVGGDVSARYERSRIAAQKQVDADASSVPVPTASGPLRVALEPQIPKGKAAAQAVASRQQLLEDPNQDGYRILAEQTAEELEAKHLRKLSSRKRATSSGLRGLAGRVGDSLHGKGTGVLGMESGTH